jgi:imidazoleglycerol phosphate synthase glutamine amidotransferase subunit HisH
MTEERKHAILLATVILTARKLQPLLEEDDRDGKPNMGTELGAQCYVKKSMERAAHILDLIDQKWPAEEPYR